MKKNNIFLAIIIIFLLAIILISPAKYISAALNGLSVWAITVLPAILPFMLLTNLLLDLNVLDKLAAPFSKAMRKAYRTPASSSYIFFMSILAGYPIGSKMVADLYEQGKITKAEGFRMSSFCSNSGPMFIVGSVGVGMLLNPICGYILLISHILSALVNGLLYRFLSPKDENIEKNLQFQQNRSFGDIVSSCAAASLNVGAIICLFFIIIEALSPIFSFFPASISALLQGTIEMTKGCLSLSLLPSIRLATILSAFVITFGGFSTIMQSLTLLKRMKMPLGLFTLQKFTQGLLAALIATILSFIFL